MDHPQHRFLRSLMIETPSLTITCDCDNPGLMRTIDGGGTGNVITISADWVTINGFTITNSGSNEEDAAIDITSNYNMINWNTIEGNGATGIYLHDSAQSNYIHHNIIRNNDGAGLFIWEQSTDNRIFHNDFIQNEWYHVKDKEGGNIWYHDYPYGGNCWDDYSGDDTNGDGIGEGSYDIMGDHDSMGVDLYPWIKPHGWNNPPKTPVISGITSGKTGKTYTYNLTIGDEHFEPGSEPFEEHVYCRVDWGDGTEEYFGPVHLSNLNDIVVSVRHQWDVDGSYLIKAKLIDAYGLESDWGTLEVSMPKTHIHNPILELIMKMLERFPFFEKILNQIA
jgi:parallel beta-helix repeat protein